MVDAQPELIRSRVPLFCFGRQPATQVLSASTVINQNAFHAPLVQVVPPEVTNAQTKGVAETTSTEIKGVLEAMVKAARLKLRRQTPVKRNFTHESNVRSVE